MYYYSSSSLDLLKARTNTKLHAFFYSQKKVVVTKGVIKNFLFYNFREQFERRSCHTIKPLTLYSNFGIFTANERANPAG